MKIVTFIKNQVGNILASPFFFNLFVKPSINDGFLKINSGYLCVKDQSPYLQSLIYWKIYERSEVKLISFFLKKNVPVIEFGASLGMTSYTICRTVNSNIPVISVEANPKLYYNLSETKRKNKLSNLTLICAAVDYSGLASIDFVIDESNLGSHKGASENAVSVPTIRLSDIVSKYDITRFCLVCDIEGAELELFLKETNETVIAGCKQIIIELHPASYNGKSYTKKEIDAVILEKFQMKNVLTDGKTWVYEKLD